MIKVWKISDLVSLSDRELGQYLNLSIIVLENRSSMVPVKACGNKQTIILQYKSFLLHDAVSWSVTGFINCHQQLHEGSLPLLAEII